MHNKATHKWEETYGPLVWTSTCLPKIKISSPYFLKYCLSKYQVISLAKKGFSILGNVFSSNFNLIRPLVTYCHLYRVFSFSTQDTGTIKVWKTHSFVPFKYLLVYLKIRTISSNFAYLFIHSFFFGYKRTLQLHVLSVP